MNRRQLLAALAGTALLAPFAGAAPTGLSDVSAAFRAAAERGRPLLVFVVPEGGDAKWTRGQAFGELLNHGEAAVLARLDATEWVAASMADLRAIVPSAPEGEPLMVLVDTGAIPARARGLSTSLAEDPRDRWDETGVEAAITARIAALEALLREALPPAAEVEAAHARVLARLAAPIPGSHWRQHTGCGAHIEGIEPQLMARCGMGHVNRRSARVLYFFHVGA